MQKLVPKSSQNVYKKNSRMCFCNSQQFINVLILFIYSKIVTVFHAIGIFIFSLIVFFRFL